MRSLKRGGRMLTCGATAGYDPNTDIRFIWTFELKILGSNSWTVQDLETLMAMIAEGRLTPAIDRVLPREQGREAVKILEDRALRGQPLRQPFAPAAGLGAARPRHVPIPPPPPTVGSRRNQSKIRR